MIRTLLRILGTVFVTIFLAAYSYAACLGSEQESSNDNNANSSERPRLLSWQDIETLLVEADVDWDSIEAIVESKAFSDVLSLGGLDVYQEMILQTDRPLLVALGFLAIKERSPHGSLNAAVQILSRRKEGASLGFYEFMVEELERVTDPKIVHDILDNLGDEPISSANRSLLLLSLPCGARYDWFHSAKREACSTSFDAAVFDSIQGCLSDVRPRSAFMQSRLAHYALIPGFPRLIYVLHADEEDDIFPDAVISILEDHSLGNVPDITSVCRRHKDYIRSNVDIGSLEVSPERRRVIEQTVKLRPSDGK